MSTCRATTRPPMPGATDSRTDITRSPSSSRATVPLALAQRRAAPTGRRTLITCRTPDRRARRPTSSGSTRLGMVASSHGWSLMRPYFAASAATVEVARSTAPRRSGRAAAGPRRRRLETREPGQLREREVDLGGDARPGAGCPTCQPRRGPSTSGSTRSSSVRRGSSAADHDRRVRLLARRRARRP